MHDGVAGVARGEQDVQIGAQLQGPVGQRPSIVAGQDHVGEQQIDPRRGLRHAQRSVGVTSLENPVAKFLQDIDTIGPDPVIVLDDENDNNCHILHFTPAIAQVLHLVETDVGRPIAHIKAKIPIEELYDDVRRVLRTLASAERELVAPESGMRYIVRMLPYRSIDNFIAGVVMTFIDVAAIMRAEERQRLLLAGLQHRVRNTLGIVRSMARRSAQTSSTVDEYAAHLDGWLSAFARIQAAVTRDPGAGVDFEYLVAGELMAYHAREGEQVRMSGPTLRLQPKAAETLSLAIHELATNAVKYGALSQPSGRVEICWRINESVGSPELIFDWRAKGGPQVKPPKRSGFGTEILERTLAFELKGRPSLLFNPGGVHFTVVVPLSGGIVRSLAMAK
jgi:two-component system, chemotaxis family, CheB/CheR fusion protein